MNEKEKKQKKEKPWEPPLNSVAFRLVVFIMSLPCIVLSFGPCNIPWPVGILIISIVVIGSYTSYVNRDQNVPWVKWFITLAIIGAALNQLHQLFTPVGDKFNIGALVIQFFTWVYVVSTFELKTRSDFKLAIVAPLILLCLEAVTVRGYVLGIVALAYVGLWSALLYFDCINKSETLKLLQPAHLEELAVPGQKQHARTNLPIILALPLLSPLLFTSMPRIGTVVDTIIARTSSAMRTQGEPIVSPKVTSPQHRARYNPLRPKEVEHKGRAPAEKKTKPEAVKKNKAVAEKEKKAVAEKKSKSIAEKKDNPVGEKKDKSLETKLADQASRNDLTATSDLAHATPGKPAEDGKKEGLGKVGSAAGANGKGRPAQHSIALVTNDGIDLSRLPMRASSLTGKVSKKEMAAADAADPVVLSVVSRRPAYVRWYCFEKFDGRQWSSVHPKPERKPAPDSNAAQTNLALNNRPLPIPKFGASPFTVGPAPAPGSYTPGLPPGSYTPGLPPGSYTPGLPPGTIAAGAIEAKSNQSFEPDGTGVYHVEGCKALALPDRVATVDLTARCKVRMNKFGTTLPAAWLPQQIICAPEQTPKVTVDDCGVISFDRKIGKGTTYSVESVVPIYDLDVMRKSHLLSAEEEDKIRTDFKQDMEIPDGIADSVGALVERHVNPNDNWFEQTESLCNFLRHDYTLTSWQSNAADPVSDFLLVSHNGSDRDFASALTVMCRWSGIPARMVVGLAPGRLNQITGMRDIRMSDCSCWTEAYIPQYGWVPFDPQPTGFLPAQAPESNLNPVQTALKKALSKHISARDVIEQLLKWGSVICIIASLGALVPFARALFIRWRKWKRRRDLYGPAYFSYQKVLHKLKRRGIKINPSQTPTEAVSIVREFVRTNALTSNLPDLFDQFVSVYHRVFFGNKDGLHNLLAIEREISEQCSKLR